MKVYIVTCGAYSDYHIHSVHPTLEEAEEIVNILERDGCYSYPAIETYEVGNKTPTNYYIYIRYYTPENTFNKMKDEISISIRTKEDLEFSYDINKEGCPYEGIFEFFIPYHKRYTDDILLKIARDHYAQYKAKQELL